jgi:diguanylate cyclase (GGDEF)-like protein/PAS domain S-box-containing protein
MTSPDFQQPLHHKSDLRIANALTWRYVIALALVASLSTAAWFSLRLVIAEQTSTAAVVNVSGRQRMLSQRAALFSNLLVTAPSAERPLIRQKLREAIDLMASSHRGLIQGDNTMGLPPTMSPAIHAMYFDGPHPLDGQLALYFDNVQQLLLAADAELRADNPLLHHITGTAATTLLSALDRMVSQYQLEGEAAVKSLANAETLFWLITLLLLALEAVLIFHPFSRHVRTVIGQLHNVTEELQLHQEHLDDMIQQRTAQLEKSSHELAESEEKFRLISTAAKDAIIIIGTDEQVIFWNPAAEAVFGYNADEVIGRNLHNLLTPTARRKEAHQGFSSFIHTGTGGFIGKTFEISALHKSGEEFPVELSISAIRLQNSWHALGIIRDITTRKKAEEKLHLAANVFTYAREGITITTADGTIIDVNDAFTRITGYSRNEVLGKNPRILSSGRQDKAFYVAMWRDLLEQGYWYGEIWNRRKDGEVYAEMLTISAIRDAAGHTSQYVALFSDITPIKEHQNQLEHIAHYDALTTLPNRVLLADRLHQAMVQVQRHQQRLAVAYLDLDGFKAINDHHGHDVGDQLLMTVASRMKQALREGDTLARLGGDEFVAVLLDLPDIEASVPLLSRLLTAAALPVHSGDLVLQVSASLGVTFYPQTDELDADQLLRQADQAMYQAKLAGKNRYHVFDAEQDRSVRGYHESLEHIRHALNDRQFVLFYQPKVNMRTGAIIGVEALIRWQHPDRGLLSPAVFLPVIEDHPLAIELGEWVIDTALAQLALWRTDGLNIPVSVNIDALQIQQPDFTDRLRVILARYPEILPGDLELEVLETSALEDLIGISHVIEQCREIGVLFSLDDFGTGYSSLTYLKRLPVTVLKIDQTFVRDMLDDPDDLAILVAVISLGTSFHRQIIAEGVETIEHGVMLLRLGCELAQGYGIAHPMPPHLLPSWAQTWRPDPTWVSLPAMSRDDLPLLFASIEHRAWIVALENHLKGERDIPPPLNHQQCYFGKWMNGEGRARHGKQPAFHDLERLHQQVHLLATKILQLHSQGREPEALAQIDELHNLRDSLLARLHALVQESRHPS